MRSSGWLWRDLRYAIRTLRRTPTLTAAAVITLALGIGVTTTVFSLIQAVALRELPVASPRHLYFVSHGVGDAVSTASHYPWFEHLSQRTDTFSGVAAYNIRDFKVSSGDTTERVTGEYVSGNYHAVLGVPFQLGRGFASESDRVATPIAVISDGYWSRQFNRSPDVIGKTLVVGGQPVAIVGVTASSFWGMQPGRKTDVTLPLSMRVLGDPEFLSRTDTWTSMPLVVRLRHDVVLQQARSIVDAVYREYMSRPENQHFSRSRGQLRGATLLPAARGADRVRREYATPLRVLAAMVVVVLLIACVNVANLLLARVPARAREVAIRMSIGASRARIAAQLMTESLALAACGGLLGVLIAAWGTEFVAYLLTTGMHPIHIDAEPNSLVLLFAVALSLLTAVTFGLAPAWKTSRIDSSAALKSEGTATAGSGRWSQRTLVVVQVALSLVLVFGAGLMAGTLRNLYELDGGFRKDGVVVFELDAHDTAFKPERLAALCDTAVQTLRTRADVLSGSCSTMIPIATNSEGKGLHVPGSSRLSRDAPVVFSNSVDPLYFETFGTELLRGRRFTNSDGATSQKVAVFSQAAARYYFGDKDPIGATFHFGATDAASPVTIVGIVRDARQQLRVAPPLMVYTPLSQRDEPASTLLAALRTADSGDAVAEAVRYTVRASTPDVPVSYVRTMDQQIGAAIVSERVLGTLAAAFAVLAVVLACVGLYGVMSYDVSRRSREFGIRMALGARAQQILGQVLRQSMVIVIVGVIVGAAAAVAAARMLSSVLFGLEPDDSGTLLLAVSVLTATALLAGYFPARRAGAVDPAVVLKAE